MFDFGSIVSGAIIYYLYRMDNYSFILFNSFIICKVEFGINDYDFDINFRSNFILEFNKLIYEFFQHKNNLLKASFSFMFFKIPK
jgi:hypothetical protein